MYLASYAAMCLKHSVTLMRDLTVTHMQYACRKACMHSLAARGCTTHLNRNAHMQAS